MTFPHTATIQGQTKIGTKYIYGNVGTTQCFLQPMGLEETARTGMTFSKSYKCYFPIGTDVKERQRLGIDGNTYTVTGIVDNGYGTLSHMKAVLERV